MDSAKQFSHSKVSVVGLFAFLSIMLTVPLVVLLSQERQDTRSKAAEPAPSIVTAEHQAGRLSGYTYVDANQNGLRDTDEKPLPGLSVIITQFRGNSGKGGNEMTVRTDSNGYFIYNLPHTNEAATYLVKVMLPTGYKTMDTNPLMVTDLSGTDGKIVEFGLYPLISPSVAPSCMPRPTCLNSVPRCLIAEPSAGWCPVPSVSVVPSTKPSLSLTPAPTFICGGSTHCPTPTPARFSTPTPIPVR